MYCSLVVGALNELCVEHWRLGAWSVGRVTIGEGYFCEIRMSESRKLAWYILWSILDI